MTEQHADPQPPPHHPGPPPAEPQVRRLTRTSWDAPVSGVCGGVARYLGVDPTLVRVLAAVAMVVTLPAGPIVYAVMWAVMPQE
jgi:phage shock protein PspC (stress-responsive transcriptional regulator)